LPKRVIEVPADPSKAPRLRVTNGNQQGQYVILSHCWGSAQHAKLQDHLLPQFQKAIPPEILPKSFKDAINITRRLGLQYLWIDALCISQDSLVDWKEEAPKMCLYYGRSTLMIAATVAEDSSKGILIDRHVPYSPVLGKEKKYCLRQRLLRWDWDIERSVLATRGWTAQERMLAPRIIHYTKRQMIWECTEGMRFEASGIKETKVGSGQVDMHFSKKKFQPIVTKGLQVPNDSSHDPNFVFDEGAEIKLTHDVLERIRTWQQCVDAYAKRRLTVSSDKFHALSGVAAVINHDGCMGHYLAGIWSNHLAIGLAWSRRWALLSSPPTYRAPSWSWASVDGESSSLALASPLELLKPPSDDMGKKWAAKFDLKLIEQHIKLQDASNVYGSVLEGSFIIIEGTCITKENFGQLSKDVYGDDGFDGPVVVYDKSNAADCPCCGPPGPEADKSSRDISEQHEKGDEVKDAHFDICLYLMADIWREPAFVDMILLKWVDQEAQIAMRVGMTVWNSEKPLESFREIFCAASWERLRLKLV
jgi:hypothetical protein